MRQIKKMLLALTLIICSVGVSAQGYKTGVGIRLGYDSGINAKHFLSSDNAIEGIVSFSPKHFQVTGLYEFQRPFPSVDKLNWFLGLGAHLGAIHHNKNDYNNSFLIGVDGIAGLEYVFPTAPFTLGLDWKPTINFTNGYNDYWYAGFALSFRYRF